MDQHVSKLAASVFGHMELVILKGVPFANCEDPIHRKYSTLNGISQKTLQKYMHLTGEEVQKKLREKMLTGVKFGIMLDGWDAGSGTHFTGLFILWPDGTVDLLAMSPLNDETSFSAPKGFILRRGL